ncbi:MAG: recombinase A [Nannocystaceae bacterium]
MADAALRLFETVATPPTDLPITGPTELAEPLQQPFQQMAQPGRLIELSSPQHGPGARTSTAASLLRHAQREGETTAWIQPSGGPLYPPDLHESGVDLESLVVVHVPAEQGTLGLAKAAELLLRSGAFGMVVLDLGAAKSRGSTAWQGRLLGLARQHESRVLLLTDKPSVADSLGPLIGLRVEPRREREADGRFTVEHHVLKNKSGAPVTLARARFLGPAGLR